MRTDPTMPRPQRKTSVYEGAECIEFHYRAYEAKLGECCLRMKASIADDVADVDSAWSQALARAVYENATLRTIEYAARFASEIVDNAVLNKQPPEKHTLSILESAVYELRQMHTFAYNEIYHTDHVASLSLRALFVPDADDPEFILCIIRAGNDSVVEAVRACTNAQDFTTYQPMDESKKVPAKELARRRRLCKKSTANGWHRIVELDVGNMLPAVTTEQALAHLPSKQKRADAFARDVLLGREFEEMMKRTGSNPFRRNPEQFASDMKMLSKATLPRLPVITADMINGKW